MRQDLAEVRKIGNDVAPIIQSLVEKLPNMLGAVLSSSDGFNICSIGLDDMDVGKMASLTSSMYSMGKVVTNIMATNLESVNSDKKKELLLTVDKFQVVIVEIEREDAENLILLVAVDKTATGILFMAIRKLVDTLEKKLKNIK